MHEGAITEHLGDDDAGFAEIVAFLLETSDHYWVMGRDGLFGGIHHPSLGVLMVASTSEEGLGKLEGHRISSKGLVFEVERILKEPRILETAGGNMGSQVMFHGLCVVTDNGNVYFRRDDPLDD